jgi:hypothetical protein
MARDAQAFPPLATSVGTDGDRTTGPASAEHDKREDREQEDLPTLIDRCKERCDEHVDSDFLACRSP